MDYQIPEKTNRVLNIILLCLLLILIRVWYLSIIQRDEHVEQARKPQRRTLVERVERATIRDRFNAPLALNKIQYNAAICYADIRHIPNAKWEKNAEGKLVRIPARVAYIKQLSELLGKELQMDPQKIEDIVHGKASLFPHTPFVIKEDLSEREYYRLKMLEKDWMGVCIEKGSKRYYPKGKIGCDIIGFMGAISSKEYYSIAQELSQLQTYLSEREAGNTPMLPKGFTNPYQVRERLKQLQEKAYTINDYVGKTGVEATFDSELRGYAGKKTCEIDIKGNVIRELPGSRKSIPGQRLILSFSSELQEYAEQLLVEHEVEREVRDHAGSPSLSSPWIKGGAIVAMDPKTGEVLALASYPRIDLNDFIPSKVLHEQAKRQSNLNKWLENENYIGEIWDGKRPLERERYDAVLGKYYEETLFLTWEKYCEAIFSPQCAAQKAMQKIAALNDALLLQQETEKLLEASGQSDMRALCEVLYPAAPHQLCRTPADVGDKKKIEEELAKNMHTASSSKRTLDHYLAGVFPNEDKILVIDLCRLMANAKSFTPQLQEKLGELSLAHYRNLAQAHVRIRDFLYAHVKNWFRKIDFLHWREKHFKEYLRDKRREEREKKRYARPYTEYLDMEEKERFKAFWNTFRLRLVHCFISGVALQADCLLQPYLERCLQLRAKDAAMQKQADGVNSALSLLSAEEQLDFLNTMRSFDELTRPLLGHYRSLRNTKGMQLEKHLAAAFYPLMGFGYGRSQAFRQSTPQGSVFKLVVAYQALLERYCSLREKHQQISEINPLTLIDDLKGGHPQPGSNNQILGYTLEGQTITRLHKGGRLPRSHPNIGKIDIVGAIEQSSNIYFAILAAEHIQDPLNLIQATRQFGFGEKSGIELPGEISGSLPDDTSHNRTGLYSFSIGQHSLIVTPLQTAVMFSAIANRGCVLKPSIIKMIAGKEPLREYRDPFSNAAFPFQETLSLVGIDFQLFTSTQLEQEQTHIWYSAPEIRHSLFFPDAIHSPLIQGMRRVVSGDRGTAKPEIIRSLYHNPLWKRDYLDFKNQIIGKTGTAEILYKQTLDSEKEAKIHNHIWFGGIAMDPSQPEAQQQPIAIIVYLRLSEAGGKEAAPLAVEMVKKWREINQKHSSP
ncbi:MAG TPA: penicillin-binding transpeptidase domain-containing protein [Rhabdochlamydiaceae bacterium]|jgi:cell division protein FtsI/penicillin-binding protein 2